MSETTTTKYALEQSLRKLLMKKPLGKVTIQEIADGAGINRMTFYYHFRDIYELIEWSVRLHTKEALDGEIRYENWKESYRVIFGLCLEDRSFVTNIYHSLGREKIELYLGPLVSQVIGAVIDEEARGMQVDERSKRFLTDFYRHAFANILLDWIRTGMKEDPDELIDLTSAVVDGSVHNGLANMQELQQSKKPGSGTGKRPEQKQTGDGRTAEPKDRP